LPNKSNSDRSYLPLLNYKSQYLYHSKRIVGTQRSDDWAMEEIPLEIANNDPEIKTNSRVIKEALKKEDLRRHLKEAQELINANQAPQIPNAEGQSRG
jgi:hypothetical protein